MKAATAYEYFGKIYIHSSSQTVAGVWTINSPVLMAYKNDLRAIGDAIKACLEQSRQGIPHPKAFGGLFDTVLALAGAKTYRIFARSAKCVEIEAPDDENVVLIPTRNGGVKEGFLPMETQSFARLSSSEDLGFALISAFSRAM